MNFDIAAYLGLGSVVLVTGLSLAIKQVFSQAKWFMLINIVLGVLLNLLVGYYLGLDLIPCLIQGIIAGLAADNGYTQVSSLISREKQKGSRQL